MVTGVSFNRTVAARRVDDVFAAIARRTAASPCPSAGVAWTQAASLRIVHAQSRVVLMVVSTLPPVKGREDGRPVSTV
jgi:hypothetical protein